MARNSPKTDAAETPSTRPIETPLRTHRRPVEDPSAPHPRPIGTRLAFAQAAVSADIGWTGWPGVTRDRILVRALPSLLHAAASDCCYLTKPRLHKPASAAGLWEGAAAGFEFKPTSPAWPTEIVRAVLTPYHFPYHKRCLTKQTRNGGRVQEARAQGVTGGPRLHHPAPERPGHPTEATSQAVRTSLTIERTLPILHDVSPPFPVRRAGEF